MNKVYNFLLLLLIPTIGWTQSPPTQSSPIDSMPNFHVGLVGYPYNILEIEAEALLASNYLNKDIVIENYWSEDIVSNQINRLRASNNFGATGAFKLGFIGYNHRIGQTSLRPWFELKSAALIGTSLESDLIKLILEGNKSNRDVSFSKGGNAFQINQYSTFTYGIIKQGDRSEAHFGLGLAMGHNFSRANISEGTISTDENGEFVDVRSIDFVAEQALGGTNKGLGVSGSLKYKHQKSASSFLLFEARDIGMIRWREIEAYAPKNKSFTYEGFDLTGFWEEDYSVSVKDSLEGNYVEKTVSSQWRLLPFNLTARLQQNMAPGKSYHVQVKYYNLPGYIPNISVGYTGLIGASQSNSWIAEIGVGGFGNVNLQIGCDLKIGHAAGWKIRLAGVESLITNQLPFYWQLGTGLYFTVR